MTFTDWSRWEIPELFASKNYEISEERKPYVIEAMNFLTKMKEWCFFLTGQPGCGKTMLAVACLKYFIKNKSESAEFLTPMTYLHKLNETFSNASATVDLFRRIADRDLIVIDDIGTGRFSEYQKEKIQELLEARFNNQKKTIITTNLSERDFKKEFGDRIYRRVIEEGYPLSLSNLLSN